MLKHLIVLLDDMSTSYCHYDCTKIHHKLISFDDLKKGVFFAMKENLMVQFVYPDYYLPKDYNEIIDSIDHCKIKPASRFEDADVVVFNSLEDTINFPFRNGIPYVLRIDKKNLFTEKSQIKSILGKVTRLNVVITDVESFGDEDFVAYKELLSELSSELIEMYTHGYIPQLNLVTDLMLLFENNNCNAGCENITLAPDGCFYVCPAFYNASSCDGLVTSLADVCQQGFTVGSLRDGLSVKNKQLYEIDHAPLCRICDAFQCKRCIWLNRKMTLEVNTPSHQQCVISHIERNASRLLLADLRQKGFSFPKCEIKEIDYLDPFELKNK